MPQQDMRDKLGKSSSPVVNRVLENSKCGQKPVSVPGVLKTAFNKSPVSVPKK